MGPTRGTFFRSPVFFAWMVLLASYASAQSVSTVAGNGTNGFFANNPTPTSAHLDAPNGVAMDSFGNLYVADAGNSLVLKVTVSGGITAIAGTLQSGSYTGDGGPAGLATFNYPYGIILDPQNNLYIGDYYNNVVRKVTSHAGGILDSACTITTLAGTGPSPPTNIVPGSYSGDGGPANLAHLYYPVDFALDAQNNLYIADFQNAVVRKVIAASGVLTGACTITTVAGNATPGYTADGVPATQTSIGHVERLWSDGPGDLYLSDLQNYRVRKVNASDGLINTIAGNGVPGTYGSYGDGGVPTAASLNGLDGLTMDCAGNLFLTDDVNSVVRKIDASTGKITTVAGNGIPGYADTTALSSQFRDIEGLIHDNQGNLYLADYNNYRVRKISSMSAICTLSPTPTATSTSTATVTQTNTMTFTPTQTRTSTASPTLTPTPTPTLTVTLSPTLTATTTQTPEVPGCDQPPQNYAYPNPTAGNSLTIFCDLCQVSSIEISVFNAAAVLVGSYSFSGIAGPNHFSLDTSRYANGIYYYLLQAKGPTSSPRTKPAKFAVVRP